MARMLDFRERTRMRKTLYAKPTILLLVVLVFLLAKGSWGMYQKSLEASAKQEKATAELNELKAYKSELDADIANLSTERGQEGEIRDRFMVAREGERVIVVTNPNKTTSHSVTVSEESPTFVNKLKASLGGL